MFLTSEKYFCFLHLTTDKKIKETHEKNYNDITIYINFIFTI